VEDQDTGNHQETVNKINEARVQQALENTSGYGKLEKYSDIIYEGLKQLEENGTYGFKAKQVPTPEDEEIYNAHLGAALKILSDMDSGVEIWNEGAASTRYFFPEGENTKAKLGQVFRHLENHDPDVDSLLKDKYTSKRNREDAWNELSIEETHEEARILKDSLDQMLEEQRRIGGTQENVLDVAGRILVEYKGRRGVTRNEFKDSEKSHHEAGSDTIACKNLAKLPTTEARIDSTWAEGVFNFSRTENQKLVRAADFYNSYLDSQ
jgi:hypothetical protein